MVENASGQRIQVDAFQSFDFNFLAFQLFKVIFMATVNVAIISEFIACFLGLFKCLISKSKLGLITDRSSEVSTLFQSFELSNVYRDS